MPSFIQRSFAGGEISPELYGRADMIKYSTGLATCKNFRVQKQGGIIADPGSYYIGETVFNGAANDYTVLIPFVFNDSITYMLAFSNDKMRVIKDGGYVMSGGTPYELTTGIDADQIKTMNFAQSGDIMTIVHPDFLPKEVKRLGDSNWQIVDMTIGPTIVVAGNPTLAEFGSDAPNPGDNIYQYAATAIDEDTGEESEAVYSPKLSSKPELGDTYRIVVTIPNTAGAAEYNVYRSVNGSEYFLIGIAQGDGTGSLTDDGLLEIDVRPPKNKNPFDGPGNYPSTVAYYQQRRAFAASNNDPEKVWLTRAGNYSNFNTSRPIQDDDAITFTLAGRRFNRIQHLVNIGRLIALTNDGEWLIAGDAGGAITPTAINAQQEGYSGAASLEPQLVGNNALYIQARGNIVRNLIYEFQSDSYSGQDLTVFATHLFKGRTIVDWSYQQTPDSIVWIVLDNGEMVGLTYLPEHDVWGWHRHNTDGFYEQVTALPAGDVDVIYTVVRREINGQTKRYIELIENSVDNVVDAFHVHAGLTFDGRNPGSAITLSLSGGDLYAEASQVGYFSAGDVGDGIILYDFGAPIRCEIVQFIDGQNVRLSPSRDVTQAMIDTLPVLGTQNFARAYNTFSGLDHLEGKVVSVLADGNVLSNGDPDDTDLSRYTVASGAITLPDFYAVVHIGLPYVCDAQTLRLENPSGETIINRKKLVNKVTTLYQGSIGFFVGHSFDSLTEARMRQVIGGYEPELITGEIETVIEARWEKNAVTCIRHNNPTPLVVQAIIPTGIVGGT